MMGKTHLALGVILLFFVSEYTSLLENSKVLGAFLLLLGTLLPDIDNAKSFVGRRFKAINWLFRHRGFFHSILAMVAFTVFVQILFSQRNISIAFLAGYGSHLLADMLTKEGVQLFYPKKLKFRGPFKAGSFLETIIFLVLVALSLYFLL